MTDDRHEKMAQREAMEGISRDDSETRRVLHALMEACEESGGYCGDADLAERLIDAFAERLGMSRQELHVHLQALIDLGWVGSLEN